MLTLLVVQQPGIWRQLLLVLVRGTVIRRGPDQAPIRPFDLATLRCWSPGLDVGTLPARCRRGKKSKRSRTADLLGCLMATGSMLRRRTFQTAGCWGAMGRRPGGPLVRVVGSVGIDRPASEVWASVADDGNDARGLLGRAKRRQGHQPKQGEQHDQPDDPSHEAPTLRDLRDEATPRSLAAPRTGSPSPLTCLDRCGRLDRCAEIGGAQPTLDRRNRIGRIRRWPQPDTARLAVDGQLGTIWNQDWTPRVRYVWPSRTGREEHGGGRTCGGSPPQSWEYSS